MTLEDRIITLLENRPYYDDTDIKEKIGYNDIPEETNLQAEIDDIKDYIEENGTSPTFFNGTIELTISDDSELMFTDPYGNYWSPDATYSINNGEEKNIIEYIKKSDLESLVAEDIVKITNNWTGLGMSEKIIGYRTHFNSVRFSENFPIIRNNMFAESSIRNIVFSNNLQKIGIYALQDNQIRSMIFPDSLKEIDAYAFYENSNLTSVTFPNNLLYIGYYAFSSCGLKNVTIPSAKVIYDGAFAECPIENIVLPNNLVYLGNDVFYNTDFQITLPASLEYIGSNNFNNMSSLTEITIPENVKIIGSATFYGCENLNRIEFESENPPTIFEDAFSECSSDVEVIVPNGYEDAYEDIIEQIMNGKL